MSMRRPSALSLPLWRSLSSGSESTNSSRGTTGGGNDDAQPGPRHPPGAGGGVGTTQLGPEQLAPTGDPEGNAFAAPPTSPSAAQAHSKLTREQQSQIRFLWPWPPIALLAAQIRAQQNAKRVNLILFTWN